MSQVTSSRAPLSRREGVGFSVADFGFNLYYTGLSLFLYYYYTDVLEIGPAIAGLIFAVPLVWDGITDPLMGVLAGRTRTRHGRFRPYLLYGTPLLALSFVAMFAVPILFPSAVVLASAIAHLVFRTCYTVVSIPYSALSANLTQDSGERGTLAGLRMIFATLGGLFTVFATLTLAERLGGGDLKLGFLYVSVIYAIGATALLWSTFFATRERPLGSQEANSLRSLYQLLIQNRALWLLIGAILMAALGGALFSKALIYYVKYVADLPLSVTSALVALTAAVSASVPLWMAASRRLSKRQVWQLGACIALSMQLVLYLSPPATAATMLLLLAVMGLGNGAFYVSFWSMLPDTVEYGEWRAGVRDEAFVFGINQFALKAASGLGIGLLGLMLEAVGYVANEVQTEQTLSGLQMIAILVPIVFGVAALALISAYPIDRRLHDRLRRAIAWRQERRSANAEKPAVLT